MDPGGAAPSRPFGIPGPLVPREARTIETWQMVKTTWDMVVWWYLKNGENPPQNKNTSPAVLTPLSLTPKFWSPKHKKSVHRVHRNSSMGGPLWPPQNTKASSLFRWSMVDAWAACGGKRGKSPTKSWKSMLPRLKSREEKKKL